MSVPFVKLGMHPGMAATYTLPHVVGEAHARDLLLTGRVVDAEEAHRIGLVSRVSPDETFLDDVLATARGIAATAPVASRLTKVALRDGGHADFAAALEWEALAQPVTLATEDLQEGVRAAARAARAGVHRPLSRWSQGGPGLLAADTSRPPPCSDRHLPSPCE